MQEKMCSWKCCRMPTLLIIGVILAIVLVFITGITLTHSINISNIVKLREKVASDSAAASGAAAAQTRAAIVEQQYGQLQQHHLSRSDLNYIAANHPKNLQRFAGNSNQLQQQHQLHHQHHQQHHHQQQQQQNKIIIEIGISNFSTDAVTTAVSAAGSNATNTSTSNNNTRGATNDSVVNVALATSQPEQPPVPLIIDAIVDGNIDSISVPAAAPAEVQQRLNMTESLLSRLMPKAKRNLNGSLTTQPLVDAEALQSLAFEPPKMKQLSIADHNANMIDFEKRAAVKKDYD